MRSALFIPLLFLTSPAVAGDSAQTSLPLHGKLARALADPALPEQLGRVAAAMTRAVMTMPVGDVQAAVDGRPATERDRRRTLGNTVVRGDADLDQSIERQVSHSTAKLQRSARAMAAALPAIERALSEATSQIDRATANLPYPSYPRR